MVKNRLVLEPEVQEIFRHIDNGDNFLLSGGAGSGKTYSLVHVIKQVIQENPSSKVACMTYTNAAVREISERVSHKNLTVSTIHDFLWDSIKHFQKDIKHSLVTLINDVAVTKIKNPENFPIPETYFDDLEDGVQYKEYLKLKHGIVSHDEVLILANYMLKTYPRLCDLLKDQFRFIFIDEYQDTSKEVIEILLSHLKQSKKKNVIGFFGDAMQAIYDNGIGNLDSFKGDDIGQVKEVKKEQNRRNPKLVIDLANKLRTDGITQVQSENPKAPEGSIKFYYSKNNDIELVKQRLAWDFDDTKQTKILNLTHNLIAPKAGFSNLMQIYDGDKILDYKNRIKDYIKDNDIGTDFSKNTFGEVIEILKKNGALKIGPTDGMQEFISSHTELYESATSYTWEVFSLIYLDKEALIDDKKQDTDDKNKKGTKRDCLIKHLFKIQSIISLYGSKQYNEFMQKTEYKISSVADKEELQKRIQALSDMVGDKTIEVVINEADRHGLCKKDDKLARFMSEKEYVYNRVKNVKFSEFQNLFNYLEGYTPFSTQHKTKGNEFNNVLIVLDNGGWAKYNFKNLFENNGTDTVLERTKKLFYVCCTRTKENLAVFFCDPSPAVVKKAKEWFGESNVCEI